jgi:hypothetical protein
MLAVHCDSMTVNIRLARFVALLHDHGMCHFNPQALATVTSCTAE